MKTFFVRSPALLLFSAFALISFGAASFAAGSDAAQLLQKAVHGTGQDRYAAIDQLGQSHSKSAEVMPRLQRLLADKDPQVRWRSARALGEYRDQARGAAAELRKLLADKDPIVQYHAAVALGKTGDRSDETVDALVESATSNDARVARAAIAALRELKPGPKKVIPALAEVLK